jgi:CheY-like chemotaxis protein
MRNDLSTYPLRLILVEDDDVDAEVIIRGLRSVNFPLQLSAFRTASETLADLLRPKSTQSIYRTLVLLDLGLPGMSGLDFLRLIRQDAQLNGLAVVVVSDSDNDTDKAAVQALSIAGYLRKSKLGPNCENLVHLIEEYLKTGNVPVHPPV